MTTRLSALLSFIPRLAIVPLVALSVVTTYWFLALSGSAWHQIDALATANSDAMQWSLAQAEVELLVLDNRLNEALLHPSQVDTADLRNRFDVLYSRVQLLRTAPVYTAVRSIPAVEAALAEVEEFLQRAAPVVDGADLEDHETLAELATQAALVRHNLRTISLAGLNVAAAASERQRDVAAEELTKLAVFAILLFLALAVLLVALVYLLSIARKRTAQVRAGEERLHSVVAAALDAIIVTDKEGYVVEYNDSAERIFGHSRTQAVGKDLVALIVPEDLQAALHAETRRFWDTGDAWFVNKGLVKLSGVSRDKRMFPIEMSVALAETDRGATLVYYIRDISARLESERELISARDQALAGEKAKAQVLAVMSHEMRTPLNGIIGGLDLLNGTCPTPSQTKFIETMRLSSQMLLDRVNTVLEISRFDAGRVVPDGKVFDPVELVRRTTVSLEPQATARRNRLELAVAGLPLLPCVGDPSMLEQVLVNLIGNAIKFTEGGVIEIRVTRQPGSEEVEFRVSDSGIGIDPQDQARIFDDFVTLDPSYGRKVEGTGLGLGITRRLVQAMQGAIGVESKPGVGSTFWVRLPLPAAPKESANPAFNPSQSPTAFHDDAPGLGLSILVVEDNAVNRFVAREMLSSLSCRVTEAKDGYEGSEIAASYRFDAILMDISMPRLDGVQATRLIREGQGPNASTPIIALTAHARTEDHDRFRAAGLSDALVKPVTRAALRAALSALIHPTADAMPTQKEDELLGLLGEDRSHALRKDAYAELLRSLADLDPHDTKADPAPVAEALHKMLGLATVVGFTEVVPHLRGALSAVRQRDTNTFALALAAAGTALRLHLPQNSYLETLRDAGA